jgi:glycine cleavage system H lipoate-binding protein
MIIAVALLVVGVGFMVLGVTFLPVIGIFVSIPALGLAWHFMTPRAIVIERIAGFLVPNNVMFHPGHAWARVEGNDIITVGMDDFAVKLLGSVDSISLPEEGSKVKQGFPGWLMKADSRPIHMLSPVEGELIAVNHSVANSPGAAFEDPYGNGWLFKVKCNNLTFNFNNMIIRDKVGEWLEDIRDNLASRRLAPALAHLLADGGEPIRGMAKAVDPEGWDNLAREFLLTWPPRKLDRPINI